MINNKGKKTKALYQITKEDTWALKEKALKLWKTQKKPSPAAVLYLYSLVELMEQRGYSPGFILPTDPKELGED